MISVIIVQPYRRPSHSDNSTQLTDFHHTSLFLSLTHTLTDYPLSTHTLLLCFHGCVSTFNLFQTQQVIVVTCYSVRKKIVFTFMDVMNLTTYKTVHPDFWRWSKAIQRGWRGPFFHATCIRCFSNLFKWLTISNALNTMKQILFTSTPRRIIT